MAGSPVAPPVDPFAGPGAEPAAFVELVRLLHGDAAFRVGRTGRVEDEPVLFRAAASLGFPAADVVSLAEISPSGEGAMPVDGWQRCLEVSFLGLYGPSSPLPSSWTEEIVVEKPGSARLRDFLDVFDHPLIALCYRIWRHYRPELEAAPDATDRMSRAALALVGILPDAVGTVLDPVRLLPFCGLLGRHGRSAGVMVQVLEGYLGVPARIEEFRARRVAIPERERFRLGAPVSLLGEGTVLGETVPDACGSLTLRLGPLERTEFASFLPGGSRRLTLEALVRLVLRDPLECALVLELRATPEDDFILGRSPLGWSSWLAGAETIRCCPAGTL